MQEYILCRYRELSSNPHHVGNKKQGTLWQPVSPLYCRRETARSKEWASCVITKWKKGMPDLHLCFPYAHAQVQTPHGYMHECPMHTTHMNYQCQICNLTKKIYLEESKMGESWKRQRLIVDTPHPRPSVNMGCEHFIWDMKVECSRKLQYVSLEWLCGWWSY